VLIGTGIAARHCALVFVVIVALWAAFVADASGQASASGDSYITSTGTGQIKVKPADRTSNRSIVAAVKKAFTAALPKAVQAGRADAAELAAASGLTLGDLLSISDAGPTGFYGPYYGGPSFGTFGPGKYCGRVRLADFVRTKSGRRRIAGFHTRRVCRVPPYAVRTVTLTFAVG
jgi:uncharacterized protein YggE